MAFLTEAANRGSISTGYEIDGSICWEDDNDENMVRNYSGDGDRRTWTYSTWVKKLKFGSSQYDYMYMFGAAYSSILFLNNDLLRIALWNSGTGTLYADPSQVFRDGSAWYHIVVTLDSTNATAADRVKIWINGVRVTSFSNSTYANMPQNTEFQIGQASDNYQVGYYFAGGGSNRGFSGYMAETHFANGTAYDENDFGEFDDNGIWTPKKFTGSHGSKGFYLKFTDSSNIGKDSSTGGIGDFSATNGNTTSADLATDSPTNNFCTLNNIFTNSGSANYETISEGATKFVNAGNAYRLAVASMGVTSGKWYWEVKATSVSAVMYMGITYPSVWDTDYTLGGTIFLDDSNDPVRYNNSSRSSFGSAFGNGDIIAFALDMDATTPTMTVYKNNSSLGNLMAGLSIGGTGGAFLPPKEDGYFPKVGGYGAATFECNFGGYTSGTPSSGASDANGYGTFEYAPPSGFYALCTKNLAEYGG